MIHNSSTGESPSNYRHFLYTWIWSLREMA